MIVTRSRGFMMLLGLLVVGFPVLAQDAPEQSREERIEQLETKLEELNRGAEALRLELEALRDDLAEEGAPSASAPEAEPGDDLMDVEIITRAEPEDAAAETLGEPVAQSPAPAAPNVFNPKIALVGNVIGSAGDSNPVEERESINLAEAEMSLQAWVDPYMQANVFIGYSEEEGAAIEEAYADFVTLPWNLVARVGKAKTPFGKFNELHFHSWSWVDAPLVNDRFFGEEGMADSGVQLDYLLPGSGNTFIELTGAAYRGKVEDVFESGDRNDLLYVGHGKMYRDLSDSSNLELGASWARGTLPESGGANQFSGVDLTYRWKPLSRSIYNSFLGRAEVMWNDRDDQDETAAGFYLSGDYQFARRWTAGLRLDQTDLPEDPSLTDRSQSLVLTFRPSEFSLLRSQLRRYDYDGMGDGVELLVQFQFAIGAHGAHSF